MSKTPRARMRKVNETLREVIAGEVMNLKDPRVGFVTITEVDTAPDLRSAVVYYSVMGDEEEQAATAAGFSQAAPHVQSVIARQVRMKYTPRLRFVIDPSIDQGLRIDAILKEIRDAE